MRGSNASSPDSTTHLMASVCAGLPPGTGNLASSSDVFAGKVGSSLPAGLAAGRHRLADRHRLLQTRIHGGVGCGGLRSVAEPLALQ